MNPQLLERDCRSIDEKHCYPQGHTFRHWKCLEGEAGLTAPLFFSYLSHVHPLPVDIKLRRNWQKAWYRATIDAISQGDSTGIKELNLLYQAKYEAKKEGLERFKKAQRERRAEQQRALKAQEGEQQAEALSLPEAGTYRFEADDFTQTLGPVSYNGHTVLTKFTDNQAANLCGKMADPYARAIAAKYRELAGRMQGSVYRYLLHYWANKALALYGGAVLTFLAGLRPLRFNNTSAQAIRRLAPVPDMARTEVDFPTLTFRTVAGTHFTLVFHFTEPGGSRRKAMQVFRKRENVGTIDRGGVARDAAGKTFAKTLMAKPSLLLFCDYLQNSKSLSFYSGVETGSCFVCGRPLTDPRSIQYGIGPTCLSRASFN